MRWMVIDSPIGELSVAAERAGVAGPAAVGGVHFGRHPAARAWTGGEDALLDEAIGQLRAYFAGELTAFTVPLAVSGGSDFERAVWDRIARIPYGEMVTYGEIATGLGDAGAARAVGTACNRNPIPVIVPCHRVVGAGGKMVGFGGGIPRKRVLLELEARIALQRDWLA
ncbi:methylated-DNA--[protein]-cysteine S-methyltransferase [Catenuloplanes atrovinosus]|uniref:Methylated-DNA--protein-cysteine methyltransferase n=1 Tax=Catenuloplanes atrovinosus TaxID=137266 RepID=A0AAE3YWR1_9ACTN|nr:methylated-DNA--[protein]-cysteine S-methyltransferase [Catenuloplanes atrovinosus]MDR7280030.1 methylated-DNA-[protein]-cysteine S-methyltransferase [Catenuloplanes atrovinosus]